MVVFITHETFLLYFLNSSISIHTDTFKQSIHFPVQVYSLCA